MSKQILINNKLHSRIRVLENENHNLESTLYQSEAAINEYNLTVEGLKRDKVSVSILSQLYVYFNHKKTIHFICVELQILVYKFFTTSYENFKHGRNI